MADLHGIEQSQEQRKRRVSSRLRDAIVLESTGAREIICSSEDFKVTLFFPVLDIFLNELKNRFNSRYVDLLKHATQSLQVSLNLIA